MFGWIGRSAGAHIGEVAANAALRRAFEVLRDKGFVIVPVEWIKDEHKKDATRRTDTFLNGYR